MEISEIYNSGILKRGEELIESVQGSMQKNGSGFLAVTNKRLMFLKKPGWFSKGLHVVFECFLGEIASITISGLIIKQLNIQVKFSEGPFFIFKFNIGNIIVTQNFKDKLVGAKNEFVEDQVIEAKNIIVEEGNKDDAVEILKKRLARGEITLEEFHQKIQRT